MESFVLFLPFLLIMGGFMYFASRRQRRAMQATIDLHDSLQPGEVKTQTMFPGYYQRPDVTAEVFDPDGFYRTGDIMAKVGPDQFVYLDRRNNVLKLAGTHDFWAGSHHRRHCRRHHRPRDRARGGHHVDEVGDS